jgi:hypothetical protein
MPTLNPAKKTTKALRVFKANNLFFFFFFARDAPTPSCQKRADGTAWFGTKKSPSPT